MRRRIGFGLLAVILAGAALALGPQTSRTKVIAWLRGERFYRRMPRSYWLAALDDTGNGNLRYEALLAVAHDAEAVPALRRRLHDPIPLLRQMAAVELARFGPSAQEAVPELRDMLHDDDRSCRAAAADALARIEPNAVP